MPKVTFNGFSGGTYTVEVPPGTTLMRAATDNRVPGIDGDCGGNCACATCHVYVGQTWLERLGARVFPSGANFVLADFGAGASRLVRRLARRGILLRDRASDFGRDGFVRITAGTRAQTRRLLRAIEEER